MLGLAQGEVGRGLRAGCDSLQEGCQAAAAAMGIILYDTLWTSAAVFFRLIERLLEVWNLVGLIWACPRTDAMTLMDVLTTFVGADDGRDGVPGVLPA